MLYQRWQHIACEHAREIALTDLSAGTRWTFADLAEAKSHRAGEPGGMCFPQGHGAEFVLAILEAWRAGAVVCPIEAGQSVPSLRDRPKGIAHLKMTSATTGPARLVAFTAEQLAADAGNIVQTMGLRREWPNLGVISLAHSYGFSNLILPLLLHGIPLVLVNSPLPEAIRSAASQLPNLTLPAVPALWRAWHDAGAIPPNVRLAISAGALLPLPLEQQVFEKADLKIHNFYGATECGGIAYDASDRPRLDAACVGGAMKNVTLTVGKEGCLEVRGNAVGETYWPRAEASLEHGCYRTRDLAELQDGLAFLRGRAGDQINVAGRKVSPETVEHALLAHPEIRECLVFGAATSEAERSEIVVACIAGNSGMTGQVLKQFLLSKLPAWQIPREWRFVESLAPNQRGKLSRSEWRTRLGFAPPP
jgi:long-chain acyl-CoA synthetase